MKDFNLNLQHLAQNAFERNDYKQALECFSKAFQQRRCLPKGFQENPSEIYSLSKLKHDCEQFDYLLKTGAMSLEEHSIFSGYKVLLEHLENNQNYDDYAKYDDKYFPLSKEIELFLPQFNRAIHVKPPPALSQSAISSELDFDLFEQKYFQDGQVLYFNNFLTEKALFELRRFCMESTIWYDAKPGGYLGAYDNDGFSCGLLYQIADELKKKLPRIFANTPLRRSWAYKYDQRRSGIGPHADPSEVNVNFWITPDVANLDPHTGGMIIYTIKPSLMRSFNDYRDYVGQPHNVRRFLDANPSEKIRIPYRANRVVFFDWRLFNETDELHFSPGFENRRINVTLLYGKRAFFE